MYGQKWSKCCKYAFGVSDEDFDEIAHERQKVTREKMINRWGLEEGEKRWQQYCNKQAQTNTQKPFQGRFLTFGNTYSRR
jgi:hypothetical protein